MKIETERLVLREIDPERDFEAWAEAMADEQTVRYLGTPPMSRAQAWRSMAVAIGHWRIRGFGFFSLEKKDSGEWIGRVGPWYPEGWPAPEVGWTISPRHLRQGYATEAARASLRYAFDTLGWSEVIHCILPGNRASIGVAEKIGSTLRYVAEGLPAVTDEEVLVYGQSR
ncbi:MAG: GNAT family N-acetyltransferase [Xanthomonadales bacterium]|nr:GNAT family N-acetyltransferase [Gammaproteobacteria bacterium]MBT8049665.1 GNAT family N-acetyltransferase [Gammaproteobacteria bacterium]MBT8055767.1 GNAT family N-acetyltransferase [Gammaproteobacteria bacterium]NNJ78981.1 GNAT family N-acetyltransferase [Xanthomonadales bacterium]NNL05176.1 GNAT family N-acetyltransferase [Xanthomonadales bacterium]